MSLLRSPLFLAALTPGMFGTAAVAQVITDGTAGPALSVAGPNYAIPETLGTINGTNLFHSFQEFDIPTGSSATFTGPSGISNVISRVTGGTSSEIDGALNSTIPDANFYFINPAGVTFGAGASVNVPAGFHVSTADQLNFTNGDVLLSAGGVGSTFSSAPVESFGFFGARAGDISFDGALLNHTGTDDFEVEAQTVSLTNARITVLSPNVVLPDTPDLVIRADEVSISGNSLGVSHQQAAGAGTRGLQSIAADQAGGDIVIDTGLLDVTGFANGIRVRSTGAGRGGDLLINADTINYHDAFRMQDQSLGSGDAGNITINAVDFIYTNSSTLSAASTPLWDVGQFIPGDAGNITITADTILFDQTSGIGASASAPLLVTGLDITDARFGRPGNISVTGRVVTFDHLSYALTSAGFQGPDDPGIADWDFSTLTSGGDLPFIPSAGSITISATESLDLLNGAKINAMGLLSNSGAITLSAPAITLQGGTGTSLDITGPTPREQIVTRPTTVASSIFEQGGSAPIHITAGTLNLLDGATIESTSGYDPALGLTDLVPGPGNISGSIRIDANAITVSGQITPTVVYADGLGPNQTFATEFSRIRTTSFLGGAGGGSIEIFSNALSILGGANINASALSANAGNMLISATGLLEIVGDGVSFSGPLSSDGIVTVVDGGGFRAGAIEVLAGQLQMSNGGKIRADGFNGGFAGPIRVRANTISISGATVDDATAIQSQGGGVDARVVIIGGEIRLFDGASITSSIEDDGRDNADAGSVSLTATSLVSVTSQAGISTTAESNTTHNAGNLLVEAPIIEFIDGGALSTVAVDSQGAAGNVTINAGNTLTFLRSVAASSTASLGNAGNVTLSAPTLSLDQSYVVSGSGSVAEGDAGDISISGDVVTISGHTLPFPDEISFLDADNGFGGVSSTTAENGAGGDVFISALTRLVLNDTQVVALAEQDNDGALGNLAAGSIHLTAPIIDISSSAVSALTLGPGSAGAVMINAPTLLSLHDQSVVSAQTFGSGAGGSVTINAGDVSITGAAASKNWLVEAFETASGFEVTPVGSGIAASAVGPSTASAGSVNITADRLTLLGDGDFNEGAFIVSTGGEHAAAGGDIGIDIAGALTMSHGAEISAEATSGAEAGAVDIVADELLMSTLARIVSDGRSGSFGGPVTISARMVQLADDSPNPGELGTHIGSRGGGPNAGITIDADEIHLNDGASITSELVPFDDADNGDGGDVTITATTLISLAGSSTNPSGISSNASANSVHNAGDVRLEAPLIQFVNGGATSAAQGNSLGDAGDVTLMASNQISLLDSGVASSTGGAGDAGRVSITAPNVSIQDSLVFSGTGTHSTGAGGDISITSDVLTVSGRELPFPDFIALLGAEISEAGILATTSGPGNAGGISITGGELDLIDALINSETNASGDAGDVQLLLTGDLDMSSGARIAASGAALQGGGAGGITVHANGIHLSGASQLVTHSGATPGSIHLTAGAITIEGDSEVNSLVDDPVNVRAGAITVNADTLLVDGSAFTSSSLGGGGGGALTINANALSVLAGGVITTNSDVGAAPNPVATSGDININVSGNVMIDGAADGANFGLPGARAPSNIGAFAGPNVGRAGNVNITANELTISGGGAIAAFAQNTAGAGVVTLDVDTLTITGATTGPLASLPTGFGSAIFPSIGPQSALITDTFSSGAAGRFVILAGNISVLDGGVIRSNTSSSGRGGTIVICPDGTLLIDGVGSALIANSMAGSTGDAGIIGVQADRVSLSAGGRVTVASAGTGQGGQILIQAHEFDMTNVGGSSDPTQATAINTLVSGAADAVSNLGAGQVAVLAGTMNIAGGSVVTTDTTGSAPAGRIVIRAGTLNIEGAATTVTSASQSSNPGDAGVIDIGAYNLEINGARISTLSQSGSGGQVLISVDNQFLLIHGEITTEVHGSTNDSNAGDIFIGLRPQAPTLTNPCDAYCALFDPFLGVTAPRPDDGVPATFVNDGGLIVGSAEVGHGGSVTVVADSIVNSGVIQSDPDSFFDVSSASGIDGVVTMSGAAFALPAFVLIPDNDYRSMCEAQQRGYENQFVEAFGAPNFDPIAPGLERFSPRGVGDLTSNDVFAATCAASETAPAVRGAREFRGRAQAFRGRRS